MSGLGIRLAAATILSAMVATGLGCRAAPEPDPLSGSRRIGTVLVAADDTTPPSVQLTFPSRPRPPGTSITTYFVDPDSAFVVTARVEDAEGVRRVALIGLATSLCRRADGFVQTTHTPILASDGDIGSIPEVSPTVRVLPYAVALATFGCAGPGFRLTRVILSLRAEGQNYYLPPVTTAPATVATKYRPP